MKASTMFALTAAILLGLGAAAVARYSGVFNPAEKKGDVKPEVPKVLVAGGNLFEGMALTARDVRVRPIYPEEADNYNNNKDKYLPAVVEAAALRVLKHNILADKPILREDLVDHSLPDSLNQRLQPNMRAVNVAVPKDRAAGGMIRAGERVDIYLTTRIAQMGQWDRSDTRTACIARGVRIIAKRNTLWTALAQLPEGKPVDFTLEANPYRAALIEYCKDKGTLSLVATPLPLQTRRENIRPVESPSDPESREWSKEEERISDFQSGELILGERDLERIFNLQPIPTPRQPVVVEQFDGLKPRDSAVFKPREKDPPMRYGLGYSFRNPEIPVR